MNYTPEQRRAIDTVGRHLCVDAGAGSGKTAVLVERIVKLLDCRAAQLDEIVAITFTDKAASEMKERLRRRCREMAPPDSPREMSYWREAERAVDESRVMTIHAFCAGLLREHAFAVDLDPEFRMLEATESELLRHKVARDALERGVMKNDAVLRASAANGFNMLIELMTRLLGRVNTMAHIVDRHAGLDAEALLARWRETVRQKQEERLLQFRDTAPLKEWIDALRSHEGECKKPSDKREEYRNTMIGGLEKIGAAKSADTIAPILSDLAAIDFRYGSKKNWNSTDRFDELSQLQKVIRDRVKELAPERENDAATAEAAQLTLDLLETYAIVNDAYAHVKSARRFMDFDDLICGGLSLLEDREDIRARAAAGVKHLLIDEFQDTDRDQLRIAQLLRRTAERAGAEVFLVGDAKQSIYKFRGAEVQVFADALREADEVIPLAKNFRSVPDVLNFVNEFFETAGVMEYEGVAFAPIEAQRAAIEQPRVEFLVPEVDDDANAEEGRRAEAELIASRLAALCDGGGGIEDPGDRTMRPIRYGDCAILFRASSDVHLYEEQLRRYHIPFYVVTGGGFYDRQEVRDLGNLLKAVYDAEDELALLGFLRGPLVAMTDQAILELGFEQGLRASFWFGEIAGAEQQRRLDHARQVITKLRGLLDRPLPELLRDALRITAFEAILLGGAHGVQRAGNLRKAVEMAERFEPEGAPSLPGYLRYLDTGVNRDFREGDAPLYTGDRGAVTLMTIHKAKGLEFPVVVVADLGRAKQSSRSIYGVRVHQDMGMAVSVWTTDGDRQAPPILKAIERAEDAGEDAEEARILYVAMTRARDWLLLGCGPGRDGSWTATLDATYALETANDNATTGGNGWTARVIKKAASPGKKPGDGAEAEATPARDWLPQITPIAAPAFGETIAVSELLSQMHPISNSQFTPTVSRSGIDPLLRGTITHAYFQAWDFRNGPPPDAQTFVRVHCPDFAQRGAMADALTEAAGRVQSSPLWPELQSARRSIREWPFLLRIHHVFISGTIDLLLDDETIVDYKTGKRRRADQQRYDTQLALYAAATRQLTGATPKRALLYYIDTGEAVQVDVAESTIDSALTHARETLLQAWAGERTRDARVYA